MAAPLGMFRSLINIVTRSRVWQWLSSFKIFNRTSSAPSVKENVHTEAQTEAGSKAPEETPRDLSGKDEEIELEPRESEKKSHRRVNESSLGFEIIDEPDAMTNRSKLGGSMEEGASRGDLGASSESLDISGLGKSGTTFTVVKK